VLGKNSMRPQRGGVTCKNAGVADVHPVAHFVSRRDPNHPGLPKWPAFTDKEGALMIFDNKCEVRMNPDSKARRAVYGA
jgi:para-nitrobenzyl esterase